MNSEPDIGDQICDACGKTGDTARLQIPMFRTYGRFSGRRCDTEILDCRLCAVCQRKVFHDKLNLVLASVVGLACGFSPFLATAPVVWQMGEQGTPMNSILPVFIAMLMIYCATKCRSRPLMRVVDFRRLEGDGFKLGHKNLFELGFYALFMSAVSAACVWGWLSHVRVVQEGFVETSGKVQVCDLHRSYETYHGRVTGEYVSARFEYVYEADGFAFRSTDFAYWPLRHGQYLDLPVATGRTVKVYYNPANPRQSYVKKGESVAIPKLGLYSVLHLGCICPLLAGGELERC